MNTIVAINSSFLNGSIIGGVLQPVNPAENIAIHILSNPISFNLTIIVLIFAIICSYRYSKKKRIADGKFIMASLGGEVAILLGVETLLSIIGGNTILQFSPTGYLAILAAGSISSIVFGFSLLFAKEEESKRSDNPHK